MDRQGGGCDVDMWVSGVLVVKVWSGVVWSVDEVKRKMSECGMWSKYKVEN